MKKQENKLPRATVEQLRQHDELMSKNLALDLNDTKAVQAALAELDALTDAYDWNNYIFEDQATGKKGLKDCAGRILIPALYDDFALIGSYQFGYKNPKAALKDGKWGFVASDGSGEVYSEFTFTDVRFNPQLCLFHATWGDSNKYGIVSPKGRIIVPNVMTQIYEPWNDFVLFECDGKFGAFDASTYQYVEPIFDQVNPGSNVGVIFIKDGVEGYVDENTGDFIPKDQYNEDGTYEDAYLFNTRINID